MARFMVTVVLPSPALGEVTARILGRFPFCPVNKILVRAARKLSAIRPCFTCHVTSSRHCGRLGVRLSPFGPTSFVFRWLGVVGRKFTLDFFKERSEGITPNSGTPR